MIKYSVRGLLNLSIQNAANVAATPVPYIKNKWLMLNTKNYIA
jgi:hypothetical protein